MTDVAPDSPDGPLPRRTGLLTAVFALVVVLGLAVAAVVDRGAANDGSATGDVDLAAGDLGVAGRGEPAPDFSVELIGGGTFQLSEHLATDGRPVVLNFWASWCAPCRAEMPDFDQIASDKPGLLVLGIAVQDSDSNARAFADEIGVSYPLGIDSAETIAAQYRYLGLPATWFIAADGIIVDQVNGQLSEQILREKVAGLFGL